MHDAQGQRRWRGVMTVGSTNENEMKIPPPERRSNQSSFRFMGGNEDLASGETRSDHLSIDLRDQSVIN